MRPSAGHFGFVLLLSLLLQVELLLDEPPASRGGYLHEVSVLGTLPNLHQVEEFVFERF